MKLSWVLCCLACVLCLEQSLAAADDFSPTQRDAALANIEKAFAEQYVFPDMRGKIVERLKTAERKGRYQINDPAEFAERVTDDLLSVSHDKHLFLSVDPAGYAAALEAGEDDDAAEQSFWRLHAARDHHGLPEMKILGGNVRYLRISGFEWITDETGRAYDSAMSFLKDGDAAIIDIRGNGGGTHAAVRYLVSHFMRGDELEMTFLEGSKAPVQSRTLEHLPAGRLIGKPLYVLTDASSASAAEAFAYDVKQFKLGQLVGGKTAGAANNNKLIPIAPNFMLSLSYGRPVHPVSQTNWEGTGVTPDVDVSPSQALEVAHSLALQQLSSGKDVSAEHLADYTWAQTAVEASLHPVSFTPDRLQPLAGNYGPMKVELRDGSLWLHRPERAVARLSPLTADGLFAVERVDGMRVKLTGGSMEVLRKGQPQPRVLPRS